MLILEFRGGYAGSEQLPKPPQRSAEITQKSRISTVMGSMCLSYHSDESSEVFDKGPIAIPSSTNEL